MPARVSVLVISYNRADDLRLCIDALYATGWPNLEVIVLDNASKDGSADVAASYAAVKLIRSDENLGFAKGNDVALEHATGEFIALINNDCVVSKSWIHDLVAFLEAHPKAAAVGGKMYLWDDQNPLGSKGNRYYAHSTMDPATCHATAFLDTPDDPREVVTLSGAAVMVRRSAIEDVGGAFLEPEFFTYYEETDFFARAIRRGWTLYYTGEPGAWHRVRASSEAQPYRYYFYMERNRLLFAYRNLTDETLDALVRKTRNEAIDDAVKKPIAFLAGRDVAARGRRDAYAWALEHLTMLRAQRSIAREGQASYEDRVREIQARASYYGHARPEVAALVPANAKDIVDVGCGAGGLGKTIKEARPGVHVRGIEIVSEQAARARRVLDDVAALGAEEAPPASWPAPDCVIFADVLEHLVDPWRVLADWRTRLKEGGSLVISIPNVVHRSVALPALGGDWEYEEAGVLDRTHLRFFTRATAIEMVERAGFRVERVERVVDVPGDTLRRKGWLRIVNRRIARERSRPTFFSARERRTLSLWLADLATVQFLIVAR